jgi:hypothetical protein
MRQVLPASHWLREQNMLKLTMAFQCISIYWVNKRRIFMLFNMLIMLIIIIIIGTRDKLASETN